MSSHFTIHNIWNDEDLIELSIEVSDGKSIFLNTVYAATDSIQHLARDLAKFREQIDGGLYDVRFGEFGPKYANGAFHARLHFHVPGQLFLSTWQQTDFEEFTKTQVASEAKMYLKAEPISLDNFIAELRSMNAGLNDKATLICA